MKKRINSSKKLAFSYYKANCRQNHILVVVIAIVIFVLVVVASMVQGKIKADALKTIQSIGYDASIFLEQGMEDQYQKIKTLDYIKDVGRIKEFGKWIKEDDIIAECVMADQETFEKIYAPAYTGINGAYPKKAEEVMLSTKVLKKLGITDPIIGMSVPVSIERSDWMETGKSEIQDSFVLSGYYTEYSQNTAVAYFAMDLSKAHGISIYPLKIMIKAENSGIDKRYLEKKLYEEVMVHTDLQQQYVGLDTGEAQAVKSLAGSYGIGITCVFILLLGVYVMIYNIFLINTDRSIQQYGLLKTIGMTDKQIRNMFAWQIIRLLIFGCGLGILFCMPTVAFVLPKLMEKLYVESALKSELLSKFHVSVLCFSILFVGLVTFIAAYKAVKKTMKLSPIEALRYTGAGTNIRKKQIKSKHGTALYKLAWRNVMRFKSQFIVSLISLAIGCEIVLISIVISKGTDTTQQIMKQPDFDISVGQAYLLNYPIDNESLEVKEENLMPDAFVNKVIEIYGVDKESFKAVYGGYGWCNSEDIAMQPILETKRGTSLYTESMFFHVVSDEYLAALSEYVKKNQLNINIEKLENGTGTLLLHEHSFSENGLSKLNNVIDQPLHFAKIEQVARDNVGEWNQELTCCGYLDITDEHFPELDMAISAKDMNYFIISEKAFEDLQLTKQTFKISFDVEDKKESEIKEELNGIIQEENEEAGSYSAANRVASDRTEYRNLYYLTAKSDTLAKERDYIKTNRMIMFMLSSVLGIMGITGYVNSVTASVVARKKEFVIMQSIGMTSNQLKIILMWESVVCVGCVFGVISTFGFAINTVLGRILQNQIPYFYMYYPIKETVFMMLCLLLICIAIPQLEQKRTSNRSDISRLNSVI